MSDTIQHRKTIKDVTGLVVRLTPFEEILRVSVTDNSVTVLVSTHKMDDLTRKTRFKKRQLKIYQIARTDLSWVQSAPITIPDDEFSPYVLNKF